MEKLTAAQQQSVKGYRNKMAASAVVLCNPLCFLVNKFGRTATRPLKSMVLDFYDVGVLSDAKCRALG